MSTTRASEDLSIRDRLNISVSEASALSGIPYTTIIKLIKSDVGQHLLVYPIKNGRKTLINRKKFETFTDNNPEVWDNLSP